MNNSRLFFTSDSHFGHYNIIKYSNRPFDTLDDMDAEIINQINMNVKEDDILWHLGDFCMYSHKDRDGSYYYNRCKSYRNRIKCRNVNIIWGNHDHTMIRNLFNESEYLKDLRISKQQSIVLCHYAMAIWNKCHRGAIHLYGHSHSMAEPWLDKNMPGRRALDVGVDNAYKILGAYRPWSLDEILDHFKNKQGYWFDHHQPQN